MTIETKKLNDQDLQIFIELIQLFEEVFEMKNVKMPDEDHLQQVLGEDSFLVFVALHGGQVVGGLTAYTLKQYYSKMPLVYIYDLAVAVNFQRQGIGKMLISSITTYCKQIGVEEVFVQADEADGYALDFYHATGGKPENVVHFSYPLNEQV